RAANLYSLFATRIEVVALRRALLLSDAFRPRAAMRPAPAAREAITATAIALIAAVDLRLRAGDEGGQAIDTAIVGGRRRRLRLVLRLRTMFAVVAMFARLLLVALIGLALACLLAIVAHVGLLLLLRLRHEARLLAEAREILAVVLAVLAH